MNKIEIPKGLKKVVCVNNVREWEFKKRGIIRSNEKNHLQQEKNIKL